MSSRRLQAWTCSRHGVFWPPSSSVGNVLPEQQHCSVARNRSVRFKGLCPAFELSELRFFRPKARRFSSGIFLSIEQMC